MKNVTITFSVLTPAQLPTPTLKGNTKRNHKKKTVPYMFR